MEANKSKKTNIWIVTVIITTLVTFLGGLSEFTGYNIRDLFAEKTTHRIIVDPPLNFRTRPLNPAEIAKCNAGDCDEINDKTLIAELRKFKEVIYIEEDRQYFKIKVKIEGDWKTGYIVYKYANQVTLEEL